MSAPLVGHTVSHSEAMSGDRDARQAYEEVFTFWKDADSDIPILRAARLEYARLR